MRFIYTLFLCLIFSAFSLAQEINLPKLQKVETFQYLRNSVAVHLFKNKKSQLTFEVGDETSTEVDSLKSMLLKPLDAFSNSMLDDGFIKIELLIDEAIKMEEVEILFHELKRLGFSKILFAAKPKKDLEIYRYEKRGIMNYLPPLTREDVAEFYKRRNLPAKKFERISTTIIKRRKREAEKLNPSPPQTGEIIPPEPKVETMTSTEESLRRSFPKAEVVYIEIGTKKKIKVNGKKIKPDDLNDFVLQKILKEHCIFIVKTKRKSSYEKFLVGMSSVVMMGKKALNIFSKKKYNRDFESLDWQKKKKVRKEMRYSFLSKIVD